MKTHLTNALHTFSKWIPTTLYPHLVRREVTSIFYHAVSDDELVHVRHLYPVVPVSAFKEALAYLRDHYTFISYDQLYDHHARGTLLPPKATHLSFDDGFAVCYTVVRPILHELGIPCTFFVTIDWLDNRMLYYRHAVSLCIHATQELPALELGDLIVGLNARFGLSLTGLQDFKAWITHFRAPQEAVIGTVCSLLGVDVDAYLANERPYLTTDQVAKMHAEGFTIGAHGMSHRKLGFVPESDVENEIVGSCQAVQAITGSQHVPFSFPQSAGNVSRIQLAAILERHPFIGLLFDTKDLRLDAAFMVNRVWAERPLTPQRELHPLPEILLHAYRDAWVEGVSQHVRKIR